MAQTGYTPILIYSSTTVSQAPAAGSLTNSTLGSELAINITDGKLFYKDNGGSVQVIAWKTTPTSAGGTGLTSYTAGDLLYYASGTTLTKLGIGTAYQQLGVNAGGTAPAWQPSATSVLTAQGDLLYASAANTLARLAKNTTATRYLANTGTSNNPSWDQINLANGVTGTLPVGNGGTGQASNLTQYGVVYGSTTTAMATTAAGTSTQVLHGNASGAPTWSAVSLTADVSGTLPTANGGTNLTSFTANGIVYASSTSALTTGSALQFNGTNMGINKSPSAWDSNKRALQIGYSTAVAGQNNDNISWFGTDCYYDGTNWRRILGGVPQLFEEYNGGFNFYAAGYSGTADSIITWTTTGALDSGGNFTISGATATKASGTTWTNPSDIRLKNDIQDYVKGLDELMQIQVKTWSYNGKGGTTEGVKGVGVIADQIMQILPDSVDTYESKLELNDSELTEIKRFDATEITWLLVNCVKQLSSRVQQLENKGV